MKTIFRFLQTSLVGGFFVLLPLVLFTGFLMALMALGVEMKSITIIGGALGVGIGFGLQGNP